MNTTISKEILSLIINLENLLKNTEVDKFDIKLKVLHLISENEKTTPNFLIEKLGMARSNLAIMCNKLVKSGLIAKKKEPLNKKEIFYMITESGTNLLQENYDKADANLNKYRNKSKIARLSKELSKIV